MNTHPVDAQMKQVSRDASGRILPGARLNPHGRPAGSLGGFAMVAKTIASIATANDFRAILQADAERDPIRFIRGIVLPLTPAKHRRELLETVRRVELAILAKTAFSDESKTQ